MRNFIIFVLFLILIKINEARLIQAQTPLNRTCLKLGFDHDCDFYSCFEQRFPCGSSYWISKWGHKYCLRMKNSLFNFDQDGQLLIEQISMCLMDKLVKQRYYSLMNINCEQLRAAGQRIVHECYMNNAKLFCTAIHGKNRDCFSKLIDPEDQHDFSVLRTLANVGQQCNPKKKLSDMRPRGTTNQCSATLSY